MNFDDLDKLFRDKLSQRKATFDESSWAAMEEMLRKRERKRPRYGWWFILPLLLLLSAGGGYVVLNSGQLTGNSSATDQAQTPLAMADSQSRTGPAPEQNTTQNPLTTGINTGIPGQLSPYSGQKQAGKSSAATTDPADRSSPARKEPRPGGSASSGKSRDTRSSGASASNKTVKASQSHQPAVAGDLPNPIAVQENSQVLRREQLRKLPTKLTLLKEQNSTPGEANTIIDSLKANSPDIHEPFEIGVAGGVQLTAQRSEGKLTDPSPGPALGAYARWHLGKGLFLNTELLYHYNRSPGYERSVTERIYGFGFEAKRTTVQLQEAHQLQVPIYLSYELLGSHGITGGVEGTWLATATGDLTKTRFSSLGRRETTTQTTQLRPEGMKTLQFNAMLGYRFDYSKRLRFQLRGVFGLDQARRDGFESSGTNYRNTAIQLMLQYQLN
jgi:hypothetical protein